MLQNRKGPVGHLLDHSQFNKHISSFSYDFRTLIHRHRPKMKKIEERTSTSTIEDEDETMTTVIASDNEKEEEDEEDNCSILPVCCGNWTEKMECMTFEQETRKRTENSINARS